MISDVDGCGTDLGVFLEAADLAVLRDGAALVGVIPPGHSWPSEGDRQQALRNGDRNSLPRLLLLERGDVLNWHLPANHALPDAITWRERLPNPPVGAPDACLEASGGFSQGMSPHLWHYRTVALEPGVGMQLTTEELVPDRQAPSGSAFGNGELPHLGLAHQYLNHFCRQSDYQELLYRTALPVGVRTGVSGPLGASQGSEPVVLGPNTVIDLPEGASFQFVEIQARSLAEHRAWLESLDQGMRRDALIPSGAQGAPRTAMEISLAASQAYALLQSQAIQKVSMFSSLLQHWCAITGEAMPSNDAPSLVVEVSPLAPPAKAAPTVSEMLTLQERHLLVRPPGNRATRKPSGRPWPYRRRCLALMPSAGRWPIWNVNTRPGCSVPGPCWMRWP